MEISGANRVLIGLGFDSKDGHVRITQGSEFRLFGGSENTHDIMQEKTLKLTESLQRQGKTIATASDEEMLDLTSKLDIPFICIKQKTH